MGLRLYAGATLSSHVRLGRGGRMQPTNWRLVPLPSPGQSTHGSALFSHLALPSPHPLSALPTPSYPVLPELYKFYQDAASPRSGSTGKLLLHASLPTSWVIVSMFRHVCDTAGLIQETWASPSATLDCAVREPLAVMALYKVSFHYMELYMTVS